MPYYQTQVVYTFTTHAHNRMTAEWLAKEVAKVPQPNPNYGIVSVDKPTIITKEIR